VLASCNYWEDFSKVSPDLERIAKAEIIPMHDRSVIVLWKSLRRPATSLYAIDLARNFSKVNPVAFQLY
jgi:hypothetical protein